MMQPKIQDWPSKIAQYQKIAENLLRQAQQAGATQAEVHCHRGIGFSTTVRLQAAETLEYHQEDSLSIVVYFHHQKGQASTTSLRPDALLETLKAACRIAKLTQPDEASGLAESHYLARDYPILDLHHPWQITPLEAIEKAKQCESEAMEVDKRIIHSDGVGVDTGEDLTLYANTQGFMGHYLSSRHTIHCTVVARDAKGNMQRDGSYTVSRDPNTLQAITALAKESGEKTIRRLDAGRLKTCQAPVIFEANVANSLIGYFLSAISGRALYQRASFLLNHCDQLIFPPHVAIKEWPYQPKGLASAPFDAEGVAPQTRDLIEEGVLKGYLLSSYSARRLGLETTGNAGGCYNIQLSIHEPDLNALLTKMGTGLLVTEVIGNGVNLVTGDYSQGVAGFWVENGELQYPVEEITIAGNLSQMYQNIIAIAGDINHNSKIQTGSILIERMTIAGE